MSPVSFSSGDYLETVSEWNFTGNEARTVSWYHSDGFGNRAMQNLNGTRTSYTYSNVNDVTKACVVPSGPSCASNNVYSYDRDGNVLTQNVTSGSSSHWAYGWNPSGQLSRVSNYTVVQGTYVYDVMGRRVMSIEGSSTAYYSFTGTDTLTQNMGGSYTDYAFASGSEAAKVSSTNGVSYYHTDGLGSTRLVTDSNRHIAFSDGYQPYGADNGRSSGSETYKFTGKPVSATTGLYYFYQRWYDSSIGRFISQDSFGEQLSNPQRFNPYVYADNVPNSLTDSTGLYTGFDQRCIDLCGGVEFSMDLLMGAMLLLGSGDLHFHVGLSDYVIGDAAGICYGCEPITGYDPGLFTTSAQLTADESTSAAIDETSFAPSQGQSIRGGARPIELGRQGEEGVMGQLATDEEVRPEEIAYQQTFPLDSGGFVRPDIVVEKSASGF